MELNNRQDWIVAPIDGKNVELNEFDWLEDAYAIGNNWGNRYSFYNTKTKSGLMEIVVDKESLTIINHSASMEDYNTLINDICDPVNEVHETGECNLYAEYVDNSAEGITHGTITFYWT